ncbi:hypothetical protein Tco_1409678 [Tanacetum coccineum]
MSSPYLIVNSIGSIVPLVKPLDIKKFESSSYRALGACFNPYRAFLRRSSCIASIHAESVIASLMVFGSTVLTELELMGDLLSIGVQIDEAGGVSYCVELSVGKEDLLTLEVTAVKMDRIDDPTLVVTELLHLLKDKHFVVMHAVAIASAQKNKGSLEAESIV